MGYTPAFDTLYTGTLFGKWPTAAVWASLLPLINARGEINLSYEAISGMTGWPMNLLRQGIEALCQPDPHSQSKAEGGRRLVPIDPGREWGWRAVNVAIYRQKASGANQVLDGRNAEKVRRYKERHRETPPDTNGTPTHTQTHTHTQTEEKNPTAVAKRDAPTWFPDFKAAYPKRGGDQPWRSAGRSASARLAEGHTPTEFIEGAKRYAAYIRAVGKEGTEFVKQASTFLGPDKPFLEPWDLPATKADARFAMNAETAVKWAEETL